MGPNLLRSPDGGPPADHLRAADQPADQSVLKRTPGAESSHSDLRAPEPIGVPSTACHAEGRGFESLQPLRIRASLSGRAEGDDHADAAGGRRVQVHRRGVLARLLRYEREPEARARPVRGGVEPPERLEDAVAIAFRDAVTVIVDGQHGRRPADKRDPYVPAGAAVVGGVGHEVRYEQAQARLPAP